MYELMVVASPDEDADAFVKKLEGFIIASQGSNLKTERLGKKPLAYQIGKHTEGEFALFHFDAPGEAPEQVVSKLKLEQEAVLRYLIIRQKVSQMSNALKVSKAITPADSEQPSEVGERKVTAKVKVEAKAAKTRKSSSKSVKLDEESTNGTKSTKGKS